MHTYYADNSIMQIPENILVLIKKYQNGQASPEELRILNEWYHSFDDTEVKLETDSADLEHQIKEALQMRLQETLQQTAVILPVTRKRKWRITAAAAALLLIILSAVFWFINTPEATKQPVAKISPAVKNIPVNDIAPGGNKAVLTLADGSAVILDSTSNGTISKQGNMVVQKLDNGLLAYSANGRQLTEDDALFFNTVSTPRGGQYQITLADGTKVWLNAASSLRFPVRFTGTERKVEVTGEVYFEVAKNTSMPFKVKVKNSEVEVMGTHFNINAYDNEDLIRTTLLEGAVKVSVPGTASKILSPGQQSGVSDGGSINIVDKADTDAAVAWMKGHFQFNSSDLKTIFRQIERWYDVEVEFRSKANLHFSGQLTRNQYVSKVLEQLALTGEVHFRIEGKKIIVTK